MTCVLHKLNFHNLSIARKFLTHDHTTEHGLCAGCFEEKELFSEFYECPDCDIFFHKECTTENSGKNCSLCRKELMLLVHCCLSCDFKFGMSCAKNKPLVKVDQSKVDEHTLHLLLKNVSFICDACGLKGDQFQYTCVTCNFMFHIHCVDFPHDPHRINTYKDIREVRAREDENKDESCKFKQILQYYSKPIEPDGLFECLPSNLRPSSDGESSGVKSHDPHQKSLEHTTFTVPTIIPPRVLPLLRHLAQDMVQTGHQQQILKSYRDTRGTILEQSLQKLGVETITKDDVRRMKWEVLEAKAVNWIHYMRISMKLLFAAEKKMCDKIFDGVLESMRDQSFAEVTANSFAMLLSFGYAIAKSKRSLFPLLEMYEIMRELHPEFEFIFGSKPSTEMKESALCLRKIIAEAAQETFADFEETVEKDATKRVVLDGSIHPLTSYVVYFVKSLFEKSYLSTLKLVFQESDSKDPDLELRSVTTRIFQALHDNLVGKSKRYKDEALSQLFLMNNIYYIVRYVRSDEKVLLGDDWVRTHQKIVEEHALQYKRISWTKVFECFKVHMNRRGPIEFPSMTTILVQERFKTFNYQFEELHERQCQWTISDNELRESLRLSVSEVLLPGFRSFLKRFGPVIESGENPHEYIRFTPEDLERMLSEFFEGRNLD